MPQRTAITITVRKGDRLYHEACGSIEDAARELDSYIDDGFEG